MKTSAQPRFARLSGLLLLSLLVLALASDAQPASSSSHPGTTWIAIGSALAVLFVGIIAWLLIRRRPLAAVQGIMQSDPSFGPSGAVTACTERRPA